MPAVAAKTPDGNALTLEEKAVESLRTSLRGELLAPADPGYADARTIWNAMIDRKPALVARCLGVADVVACLRFARSEGVSFSIKSGGHNIAGLALADGALTIDLSRMRGVHVNPKTRRANVQGGALLGDVDRETQLHGLAACLGFVSLTGVAGLTLGGGFGYLTRRFGWSCDNVVSMDMVLADGSLVRASEEENADLFWGLRGAGGNFGVATNFEYRLEPVGPEIVGGAIAWPAEEAPAVLELHRKIVSEAPPELACVALLRPAPPAPWLPKEMHGKPIVALVVCHSGDPAEGEKQVAAIKSFGKPVGDVVQRRPYVVQQSLLDGTQPKGRRYYWKSEYLGYPTEELAASMQEHAKRIPSPHSAVIYFPLDGALNRLPDDHSAVGNRDAKGVINLAGSWEAPGDDAANLEWARSAWKDMKKFSTGGTYVNFLTEEETGDRIEAAYGKQHARLEKLKAKWDPENFFRTNKNIQPRP